MKYFLTLGILTLTLMACTNQSSQNSNNTISSSISSPISSSSPTPMKNPISGSSVEDDGFDTLQMSISTKSKLSVAIVEADSKYHIWMEGRSGILRTDLAKAFWLEQGGVSIPQGTGQRHLEIDGHDYFTMTTPSKVSLSKKIEDNPKNTTGIKVTLEMTGKGKYITQVVPPTGRSVKVSSSIQKPLRTAILEVENKTDALGTPTPQLNAEQIKSAKANKAIPMGATKVAKVEASKEQQAKWTTDLQNLLGSNVAMGWSSLVNLDGDEAQEGLICVTESQGKRCYVWDTINNEERYYSAGLIWDDAHLPNIFTLDKHTYVSLEQKMQKTSVFKVLRFDGSGYDVDQI